MGSNSNAIENREARRQQANSSEFAKQLSETPKPKKSILPTPEEVRNHLKNNN